MARGKLEQERYAINTYENEIPLSKLDFNEDTEDGNLDEPVYCKYNAEEISPTLKMIESDPTYACPVSGTHRDIGMRVYGIHAPPTRANLTL